MFGNSRIFPVICVVVAGAQLLGAQNPFSRLHHRPSRNPPPSPWGVGNEIYGSGPSFRPPPGLLIAGHGPPVARPRGPVHPGGRLIPIMASSTPVPSVWPSHGPQIQRAQESSHYEYEVFPHPMNTRRPPLRGLRPTSPIPLRTPIPTQYPSPVPVPPEMLRILAQEQLIPVTSSPKPQSRTDRPPMFALGGRGQPPPNLSPASNADFQEGFRILSDLFMENAGADIRSNLVGGGEISYNGNYYPIAGISAATAATGSRHANATSVPSPVPAPAPINREPPVQITPAQETPILMGETSSSEEEPQQKPQQQSPVKTSPNGPPPTRTMQQSESSYSSPNYQPPSNSHSFMFSDPNDAPGPYDLYSSDYQGPPPPFHSSGGNSIIPAQPLPQQTPQEVRNSIPPPPQQKSNQNGGGGQNRPPQNYGPPPQNQGYNGPPQNGGYNGPTRNSGYNNGPPRNGGYNLPPPHLRQVGKGERPIMMMPIGPLPSGDERNNGPPPSSEEVHRALGILARYASQQAQQMGVNPQQMAMKLQAEAPNNQYGAPRQQQSPPDSTYGAPSSSFTAPPEVVLGNSIQSPSSSYAATTSEAADAITISAGGLTEESSPLPQYGAPSFGLSGGGNGWGSDGGANDLITTKINALNSIGAAVSGGFKQITGLKAGIFNAGLSAVANLGKVKGDVVNSLKIPIVPQKPGNSYGPPSAVYGAPESSSSPPSSEYGPPSNSNQNQGGWGQPSNAEGPIVTLFNAVKDVAGGVVGTVAQTGKAAIGIGVSKNDFVKNHFAIKGQLFTETMAKKIENKNQYFQNVLKHVQSIFNAARKPGGVGWSRR